MKWLLLVSLLVVFALPLAAQRGPAPEVAPCFRTAVPAHPYDIILGRPTEHSMTASVLSYAAAEGYLEWGTTSGRYTVHTDPVALPAGQPTLLTMQPLLPDTGYVYRLRLRTDETVFAASPEYRFHTPRPPGSSFTFTITADSHLDERTNTDLYATTLRNVLADQPDFHLDLGDTFMGDKVRALGQPIAPMYLAQRYYFGLLCPQAPLFFVTGNHDGECGGEDPEAVALRQRYVPNPVTEGAGAANYYSWTWGDALFIVLDPFTYSRARLRAADENWSRTLGETQYRWLRQTLEASKARLKFVFIHHLVGGLDKNGRGGTEAAPCFEWGGRNLDGTYAFDEKRPGWGLPVHQLLVKYGVTAVFHGHDHFYDRQELDGIIYQEVPQPGWLGGERANQTAEYGYKGGVILPSSGHLRVRVGPTAATVEYVRAYLPTQEGAGRKNGQVADCCEVAGRP